MRLTDEQKEVMSLLPQNIKETNELTDAAKLILANIMLWSGTDHAKNEGYVYRTNKAMKEDTGIKSEKTIIAAVNKLVEFGFIDRKAGQRKSASEYRLNTVKIENYTVKIDCKNTVKNYSDKLQYKTENYSEKLQYKNYSEKLQYKTENYSEKLQYKNYSNNEDLLLIINELQEKVEKLQYKITVIENEFLQYKITVKNYSNKNYSENKNYSTDIDIELDKEKEINNNINFNKIDHEKNILNENNNNLKDDHEKEFSDENLKTISDMKKDNENLNLSESEGITENENESISSEFEQQDENENEIISESSNSDTSKGNENLKSSTEVEDKNKNTISITSKDMKTISDENFKVWGKIQPLFEKTTGRMEEYIFTEYESLHNRKDYAGKYNQVKRYINIEANELQITIPVQGTFGILSSENGRYSFIIADSDVMLCERKNNPNELVTTGGGGEQRNTTEPQETSNNAPQAVEMSQVEQLPTEAKKVAPVQSQNANTQSCNDAIYLTTGISAEEWDEISHKHGSCKGAWRDIAVSIHGKEETLSEALNHFKETKKDGTHFKDTFTYFYYADPIFANVDKLMKEGKMTTEQMEDFSIVFGKLTKGIANYWKKVFASRAPRENMLSEVKMWEMLGRCNKQI